MTTYYGLADGREAMMRREDERFMKILRDAKAGIPWQETERVPQTMPMWLKNREALIRLARCWWARRKRAAT